MSENGVTSEATKPAKTATVYRDVTMNDGRVVKFAGKRRMIKTTDISGSAASVTFDFDNGETRTVKVDSEDPLLFNYVGHGIAQKVGDETAGDTNVDDMILHVDSILGRLAAGSWDAERATGDGFSGASVVIRAIMEVTGKDLGFVKAQLEKKLEAGKAEGVTRQKLYQAFRKPGTKIAEAIARIEAERAAKDNIVDPDEMLADMMG